MAIDYVEYLKIINEEQNMTKAANRLYISQPALTNAVNKLERSLGVKLLNRTKPPVQLTAAGMMYVREMGRIQVEVQNLYKQLAALNSPQRQFNLGIGLWRGTLWLPWLIPLFRQQFRQLQLNVSYGSYEKLESMLLEGKLDAAFGSLNLPAKNFEQYFISREPLVLVVPRQLNLVDPSVGEKSTLDHPVRIDPQVLHGQPFIRPEPGNSFYRFLEQDMMRFGFRPGETIYVNPPKACFELCRQGIGIALLPGPYLVDGSRQEGEKPVYYCKLTDEPRYQNVNLYGPTGEGRTEVLKELAKMVQEYLSDHTLWKNVT